MVSSVDSMQHTIDASEILSINSFPPQASLPLMDVFRSKFPESTDFSMFMLDQEDSDEKQSSLLRELLAQITSAKPWFEYISYLQHQKCGGK